MVKRCHQCSNRDTLGILLLQVMMRQLAKRLYITSSDTIRFRSVIPPVEKTIKGGVKNAPGVPFTVACYTESTDGGVLAKSSVPAGIKMAGHYNGKIDSLDCLEQLKSPVETMKMGANRKDRGVIMVLLGICKGNCRSWDFSDA